MEIKQDVTRGVNMEVLSVDEENRAIDFVITSEAVDSYGTVFRMNGWDLERYRSNPIVTYNHWDHTANPDDVIGTSELRIENGKLIARTFFENGDPEGDDNKKADKVFRKAKKGTLRGASISAMIYEADYGNEERGEDPDVLYFSRQTLVAWSVVTVPSNPEALSRSHKQMEEIRTAVKSDPKGGAVTRDNDKMSIEQAQILINENEV